jgi:hypothetical protein
LPLDNQELDKNQNNSDDLGKDGRRLQLGGSGYQISISHLTQTPSSFGRRASTKTKKPPDWEVLFTNLVCPLCPDPPNRQSLLDTKELNQDQNQNGD